MSSCIDFRILRTTTELEAAIPAWRALWLEDQSSTPFQSPEWLLPWWHCFGSGALRAVSLSQKGRLAGFLPFYVYREERNAPRRLMLLGVGTTDYLDGVFAPACHREHIREAIDLLSESDDWDVFSVTQLQPHSRLFDTLKDIADQHSILDTESCSRMSAVRVADLPQKIRRNAMYYRNRAARQGALRLSAAGPADWADSFETLVRLHTERWTESGCAGVFADPRVRLWHREALPLLERGGMLRLYSLCLNDKKIGVIYALVDPPGRPNRTLYIYLTGYSREEADLRPGTVSLAMAIEDAFNNGVESIDMLRGDEDYKRLWHLERVPTYGFSIPRSALASTVSTRAEQAA